MVPGIYFIIALVFVMILIFGIVPMFYQRKIEAVFMKPDSAVLYILTNAYSTAIAKGGATEAHRLYFNKVDLSTGKIIFRIKLKSFRRKMLSGFSRIPGVTDLYTFVIFSGNSLYIVDNNTGRLIATQKDLEKKLPQITGFKAEDVQFDADLQALIIYSNDGHGYRFDPGEFCLHHYTGPSGKKNEKPHYQELDSYHFARLAMPDSSPIVRSPVHSYFTKENTFNYFSRPGSKRHYVFYGQPNDEVIIKPGMKDFLHPQLVTSAIEKNNFFQQEDFLVIDFIKDSREIEDIQISRVSPDGEIKWSRSVKDLLPGVRSDRNSIICFEHLNNKTYLISYERNTSSNKLMYCVINRETGEAAAPGRIVL